MTTATPTTSSAPSSRAPYKASSGRSRSRTRRWSSSSTTPRSRPTRRSASTLYKEANREIMTWLPGVPYAHSEPALAFPTNVKGYVPSPTTNESFAPVIDPAVGDRARVRRATCFASSSAGSCSSSRSCSGSRSSSSSGSGPCRAARRRRCSASGRRPSRSRAIEDQYGLNEPGLRAVLHVPDRRCTAQFDFVDSITHPPAGRGRVQGALPGHDRARARGDALLGR